MVEVKQVESSWAAWGKVSLALIAAGAVFMVGFTMKDNKPEPGPYYPQPAPAPFNPYVPYEPVAEQWYRPTPQMQQCLNRIQICDGLDRRGQLWVWAVNRKREYKYMCVTSRAGEAPPQGYSELPPLPDDLGPPGPFGSGAGEATGEPTLAEPLEPTPDKGTWMYHPQMMLVFASMGAVVPDPKTQAAGLWGYAALSPSIVKKKLKPEVPVIIIPTPKKDLPIMEEPPEVEEPIIEAKAPEPVKQEPPVETKKEEAPKGPPPAPKTPVGKAYGPTGWTPAKAVQQTKAQSTGSCADGSCSRPARRGIFGRRR
jgi:hypothetical protein